MERSLPQHCKPTCTGSSALFCVIQGAGVLMNPSERHYQNAGGSWRILRQMFAAPIPPRSLSSHASHPELSSSTSCITHCASAILLPQRPCAISSHPLSLSHSLSMLPISAPSPLPSFLLCCLLCMKSPELISSCHSKPAIPCNSGAVTHEETRRH